MLNIIYFYEKPLILAFIFFKNMVAIIYIDEIRNHVLSLFSNKISGFGIEN
jgi:hypothetical protein